MKSCAILCALIGVVVFGCVEDREFPGSQISCATGVINALSNRDEGMLNEAIAEDFRADLTTDKLMAIWDNTCQELGAFRGLGNLQTYKTEIKGKGAVSVLMTCNFESGPEEFIAEVTLDNKLASFSRISKRKSLQEK